MQRVKSVEVAGHVIGPDGPAKRTWVALEPSGGGDFGSNYQDTTDEKGNFRLKGVPPGSYVFVAYQRAEGEEVYEAHARQKVEVGGENIESLVISLVAGAKFQGRVTVAGPGSVKLDQMGVNLLSIDDDGEWGGHGRVKKDGTFEIASVKDGHTHTHTAIQVWGLEHDWYVKSVRFGLDDILEKGLQVEKGASDERLEIVVSSASAQLEGSVTDGEQAMIGARVRITLHPETPYNRFRASSVRADQTGHFSVSGLTPGKYCVIAKSPASPGSDSLKSEPQFVTLSEHDHKTVDLKILKA